MDGAHGRAAALEPAADVKEARGVAGTDGGGARVLDAPELVGEHRRGHGGVPHGEEPADETHGGESADETHSGESADESYSEESADESYSEESEQS